MLGHGECGPTLKKVKGKRSRSSHSIMIQGGEFVICGCILYNMKIEGLNSKVEKRKGGERRVSSQRLFLYLEVTTGAV